MRTHKLLFKIVLHNIRVCDSIKESMFDCGGAYADQL